MFEFGKIVLVPFPFTDLTSAKIRPALILSKSSKKHDVIVAFISSKITSEAGTFLLDSNITNFSETGLKVASEVRLDKIATLNKAIVLGELGCIDKTVTSKMKTTFEKIFGF
jgi:mRNA interferase MazF